MRSKPVVISKATARLSPTITAFSAISSLKKPRDAMPVAFDSKSKFRITVLIASNKLGNLGLHFVGVPKAPGSFLTRLEPWFWRFTICLKRRLPKTVFKITVDNFGAFCTDLCVRRERANLLVGRSRILFGAKYES